MGKNQELKLKVLTKAELKKALKKQEEKSYKRADRVFSLYIRIKYSDENGICICVTCGRPHHYKEIHNGHFVKREFFKLRYNEFNCHPQCVHCNKFLSGNQDEYSYFIIKTYGIKVYDELMLMKNLPFTENKSMFCDEKYVEYKEKLKNLLKERNLTI